MQVFETLTPWAMIKNRWIWVILKGDPAVVSLIKDWFTFSDALQTVQVGVKLFLHKIQDNSCWSKYNYNVDCVEDVQDKNCASAHW